MPLEPSFGLRAAEDSAGWWGTSPVWVPVKGGLIQEEATQGCDHPRVLSQAVLVPAQ